MKKARGVVVCVKGGWEEGSVNAAGCCRREETGVC